MATSRRAIRAEEFWARIPNAATGLLWSVVRCSVLQCVAMCCSVLQFLAAASFVWSVVCVPGLLHVCAMTHFGVCHELLMCVP